MTIAVGFNCPDGFVLCTDSLDSDGVTKSRVDKIWCYETEDQRGIAIASAGESDFIESFTDNLGKIFTGEHYDNDWIMQTLRQAINAARVSYPDLGWSALFSIYGPLPPDRKLLRVSENSKHLAPVARYEAIGIGSPLAKFLCAQLYTLFMSVEEAAELAVFIVSQCIEHTDGCDYPISLLEYKVGDRAWRIGDQDEIRAVLDRFKGNELRKTLLEYWRGKTPHIQRTVKYDDLRHGGFVRYLRAAALKPKRSASRKSKGRQ